jgi:hypothetical protein
LEIRVDREACGESLTPKAWCGVGLVALGVGLAAGSTPAQAQQVVSGPQASLSVTTNGDITQPVSPALDVTGATDLDAGTGKIVLNNADNVFGGMVSAEGMGLDLVDSTALMLGTVDILGNARLKATGAITQTGAVEVSGTTTLEATGNITLSNASNDFQLVSAVSTGGNISIVDANALTVGPLSAVAGTVTLSASAPITQSGGGDHDNQAHRFELFERHPD